MIGLAPLEVLYEAEQGEDLPLPAGLAGLCGRLRLPLRIDRPYVVANFVTTLDGVVSLGTPGHEGGGDISGFNQHDRMVMGLLRAISDAVVVGAGTLRAMPAHLWTAEYIFPSLAYEYRQLRAGLGMPEPPVNVIVSGSGRIGPDSRVVHTGEVPALVVTTTRGAERLHDQSLSSSVKIATVAEDGAVGAGAILDAIGEVRRRGVILVEGGPHLIADFFAEQRLDELFLTLAPQIAGRDGSADRPGLVSGMTFAPDSPLWGTLVSVRRAGSHLFLRYSFAYNER